MSTFWPQLSGVANLPVNQQGQKLRTITKKFAPQARGRTSSTLGPSNIVNPFVPPVLVYTDTIGTLLAKQRRSKPPKIRGLSRPTVVNPFVPPTLVYTDALVVRLTYQSRRRGSLVLVSPIVVFVPQALGGTAVQLVPVPSRLHRQTRSELKPPTVTN